MTIVAVVLLSVAAAVCVYSAWFFLRIAYRALLEKVLRAITGRQKPDYARIGELEARDPGLPIPERITAMRNAGEPPGGQPDNRRFPIASPAVLEAAREHLLVRQDVCANCLLFIKPCPRPDCERQPPWVHLAGSHRCPGTTGMVLAMPGLWWSVNGGASWMRERPMRVTEWPD